MVIYWVMIKLIDVAIVSDDSSDLKNDEQKDTKFECKQ